MNEISVAVVLVLLTLAAWWDVTSYRIPNLLILVGLIIGMVLSMRHGGMPALLVAIQGLFVGLVALLPMYLLRAMGAGDVKLMGLVGVFLGPLHVLGATLSILLVGGVLALVFAIHGNKLHSVLGSVREIVLGAMYKPSLRQLPTLNTSNLTAGNLPYAVAIGLGTSVYLLWQDATWLGVSL